MPLPTLSVIIPNYNHAALIPSALTAILEQSARPKEVFVIDDGSTDNSVEVIESFARRDPIVQLIRNERNCGVLASAARGFESSMGDFIFFAAADDRVLPGFFERSLRLLAEHPQAGLSFAFHSTINGVTGEINPNPNELSPEACYFTPQQLAEKVWGGIPGHSALIKRAAFVEAGGYLPELKWHCDWFNSLVIAFRHGACFIPECLSLIREMPTSYSGQGVRDRSLQRGVLANLLRLLVSPRYRDVLSLFQNSRILEVKGPELAHGAVHAGLHRDPDVISLVATLQDDHLVTLQNDSDPEMRRLAMQAVVRKLLGHDASVESAMARLHSDHWMAVRRIDQLQSQLNELQSFVDALRNSAPFTLRRRAASAVRRLTELVSPPHKPHPVGPQLQRT